MNATGEQHRAILQRIARRAMTERGLLPDFSAEALSELGLIQHPASVQRGTSSRPQTTCSGLPSTTTTPATWTSLPSPRRCPETKSRSWLPWPTLIRLSRAARRLTITLATTRPRSIRRPRSFRCFPRSCRPISRRLGFNADRLAIIVETVIGTDGSRAKPRHLPGVRAEPGKARLQQRCGLAGRRRSCLPRLPRSPGLMKTCDFRTGQRKG